MKKLTARNEAESRPEKKRDGELKSIPVQGGLGGKGFTKVGGGGGFTKVGGGAGGGFKKVGTAVGGGNGDLKKAEENKSSTPETKKDDTKLEQMTRKQEELQPQIDALKAAGASKLGTESPKPGQADIQKDNLAELKADKDVNMGGTEEEDSGWEEYDFTKPTGCDHANCPGCNSDGIWDQDFEPIAI
jgi:hypothetical protein